ncbi:Pc13g14240 [Penicillium rubens Wisconsin 54-1255]|uniref:Pc13g14240 protein n=1 Tax=Penicillium rubens (strain ATCC 28089 / DSM 1075 / NRRL 1951 / Wisconsin 54-1255) TaxID=500485 RepID=B6H5E1_PENRW|nr:Pc13g14240 [Penicillium rubens Wisconsin 54-1255]
MSVFTIVHRALPPLSLSWKRRTSLKGKAPELEAHPNEKNPILSDPNSSPRAQNSESTSVHRDVHGHVQVAVKTNSHHDTPTPQSTSSAPENITSAAPDSSSEGRTHCSRQARPTRAQLARAVSWASIIRSRDRWTAEQEKELVHAQRQLGRYQKAWSSEQEVWLSYVQALSEEKEAHACFLSMRHRQQDDEQHQFRKAWKRRRCSSGDDEMQKSAVETANRLGRLRRLQRYGYSGQRLGTTRSAVLTVEG